ncbi:MAG: glycoside hydrolase, partial [Ignavibacteriaceae bacterium]|nr:glycoside hydrolase [Ignavibacteriaceae bacterium]
MKNLSTLLLALFLTSLAFAQSDKVEPIPPMKDGLRGPISPEEYQNLILREKLGEFPFRGGIVDQQAQVDALVNNNAGSTGTGYFTQSETDILAFGDNILIGFNDSGSHSSPTKFTGFSYSTDGGATFIDGDQLPTNTGGDAGDPVFGRNETTGRIYFSTLGWNVSTIQVFRSDDNGLTWMTPVNGTPGGGSEDKQWITVDNFSGPGNGNVYLITRSFGNGGIFMYRSTDNGNTFGPSGGVSIVSGNQGAFVAVGPDHSVYAFWYAGSSLQVRKSTDQGVTFGSAVTVASGLVGGVNGDLGLVGIRQGTSTASSFRSSEFPHAAVNPVSGDIYVTYDNDAAGVDKADVFMTMSTDGGATWSASTRVNDDATTTDQWQPTIAVTPDGQNIGIFYYSRQEDAANNLFKYYGRTGTISGSTISFTPSFAISDVASLPEFGRDSPVNTVYMGDYNHAVATDNAFHVVWSDNRDDLPGGAPRKDPNVYYEKIILGPPCPVGVATNPNPASGTTNVSINLPQVTWTNGAGATSIEVFFNGSSVYTGAPVTSYSVPGPLTYSTTYSWRVNESNGTCTSYGPNWTFTTMQDPNLVIDTMKIYPGNGAYWTGTCTASAKTDTSEVRGANSEDGWIVFDVSSFPSGTIFTSAEFFGYVNATYYPYWSLTPMGTIDPRTATA